MRLLTPHRLRIYPVAILIGVALGYTVFVATSDGLRTVRGGRMGGDFAGFYGAGLIVRDGADLYDRDAQKRAQAPFLPDHPGGWIDFAYPPYVAAAYVPFTALSFKHAYLLHTLLAAACTALAVWLLAQTLAIDRRYLVPCMAAALTFYPLFRAIVGGQNTAFSLLCAAGALSSLGRGRDLAAGFWLGAWLFKPQFALAVGAITAMSGRVSVLPGVAAWAVVYYVAGAVIGGPGWPIQWWSDGVVPFAAADVIVDRGNGASLIQLASERGVAAAGWGAAMVLGAAVIAAVWRRPVHPTWVVATAAVIAVLCAPHALFYDGGLAVLPIAVAGAALGERSIPSILGLWLGAAVLPALMPPGGAGALVLLGSLAMAGRALLQTGPSAVPESRCASGYAETPTA